MKPAPKTLDPSNVLIYTVLTVYTKGFAMSQTKKEKTVIADKEKKPKLVRDSFTIPKNEYEAIDALKARAMAVGTAAKKSELLRAGLMALTRLDNEQLKAALSAVPTLKTGRPKAEEAPKASKPPVAAQPSATPSRAPARKAAVRKTASVPMTATGLPTTSVRKSPVRQAAAPAKKATGTRARKTVATAQA
jgi:hypothetical protein